jgi:hypothetical protein
MNSFLKTTLPASLIFVAIFIYSVAKAQPMTLGKQIESSHMIVEIRTYNLKPNSRDTFHQLFVKKAKPMLEKCHISVVGFGPSIHEENTYTLIREYESIEHMKKSEDAFYGSDEWKKGPREEILALIENYTTLVLQANQELINQLHKSLNQQN